MVIETEIYTFDHGTVLTIDRAPGAGCSKAV